MKIIGIKVLVGAAVLSALWAATPAGAIPITDSVNPADTLITQGSTPTPCPAGFACAVSALSFVHNITDSGFAPLSDIITSATVAIHLTDSGGSESYEFSIGVAPQTFTSVNVPGGGGSTDTVTFSAPSLADLQADGMIAITVTSTSGSFSFADSLLTAQVTKLVPEPSTLLLLGAGLVAFGWRVRRRN